MKKLVFVLFLLTTSSFAAYVNYFTAVLNSDAVAAFVAEEPGFEVKSIKQIATYRCPGCYDFEVILSKVDSRNKGAVFQTRRNMSEGYTEVKRK